MKPGTPWAHLGHTLVLGFWPLGTPGTPGTPTLMKGREGGTASRPARLPASVGEGLPGLPMPAHACPVCPAPRAAHPARRPATTPLWAKPFGEFTYGH